MNCQNYRPLACHEQVAGTGYAEGREASRVSKQGAGKLRPGLSRPA